MPKPETSLVGLLLAAGFSRRFGSNKLLQDLAGGEPVAGRVCRTLASGTDRVLAVVRPGQQELSVVLKLAGAEVVTFEDAQRGMGASLAFGVRASPEASGWLVTLADMPWIKPDTIRAVAAALRSGADLVAPTWQGRRGHPVGFGSRFRQELCGLDGDQGAKALLDAHSHALQFIPCADTGIFLDIDLPADLERGARY